MVKYWLRQKCIDGTWVGVTITSKVNGGLFSSQCYQEIDKIYYCLLLIKIYDIQRLNFIHFLCHLFS